jgi:nucleoside-diphosphate-sugar epimerase
MTRQRILITGAAGRIGIVLSQHLAGRYELRLMDARPQDAGNDLPFVQADIADLAALGELCRDVGHLLAFWLGGSPRQPGHPARSSYAG